MAYYNKVGLLVLHQDKAKFLVCEKDKGDVTADYIMPGGQFFERSPEECLRDEIKEELNCEVDIASLNYINEYLDVAAGAPDKDVSNKLCQGTLIGEPTPSTEIKHIHWIGLEDKNNPRVSPIIRNKIIPDLEKRGILK